MKTTLNINNSPVEIELGNYLNVILNLIVVTSVTEVKKGIFMGLYIY